MRYNKKQYAAKKRCRSKKKVKLLGNIIDSTQNLWGENTAVPLHYVSGGVWKRDASYALRRRNSAMYLLLYTIGGEGRLVYEGQEHRLLPGTVFLIDCRREQIYGTVGAVWEFAYIHFTAPGMQTYVDGLYRSHGAVFQLADGTAVENRMRAVIELFRSHNASAPHLAFGQMAGLLGLLYAAAEKKDGMRLSELTVAVLAVLEEHYAEKLTLDEIARQTKYSKYYLAHCFKEEMKLPLHEYLTLLRIAKSKLFLQSTDMPIAEIARCTGFPGTSNFIRTFSSYESVTPLQYRKKSI